MKFSQLFGELFIGLPSLCVGTLLTCFSQQTHLIRTAFPILQSYSYAGNRFNSASHLISGEFTPLDRFRAALKENLLLYVILFAIGAVLITIIAIQRGFGLYEINNNDF